MIKMLIGDYRIPDTECFEFIEKEVIYQTMALELDWLEENIAQDRYTIVRELIEVPYDYRYVAYLYVKFLYDEDAVLYRLTFNPREVKVVKD